ncbi:hypothetical protein, variant [Aphanomyces invadans]|uniref:Uncharacterized protein n=1 Tax=Aphanomyces invadans TaxID=157072 RepID=A0A024U3U8_9STRA|nr:hypothetical protein, variant [Aphanomyces invadans]ETW01101.1 hypothetical protein, variant [Aphanomyces invadans]|eukprot:XP_008870099.1 hypothetical protein, variant [Aphanomyces invadans]
MDGVDGVSSTADDVHVPDDVQPLCPPPYVEQFVADDACAALVDNLCDSIALISEAKSMEARVLTRVSNDAIAQLFAAVGMVLIERTDSFDAMGADAPPPLQADSATDTSGFLRALGRLHSFVTRRRHSAQAYMAQTSCDGSVSLRHDDLASFLHGLPLYLTKREVNFVTKESTKSSNTDLDVRLDVHSIAKVVANAIKTAKKKAGQSPYRPPVVFLPPEESSATPNDVHAPKELKARRPADSPERADPRHPTQQLSTFRTTHRSNFAGGDKRGTKYSIVATIQTHKLSMDDVELHVALDAVPPPSSPDKVDQATMSNIFSLGTPRLLSPRELARRRDILSYLDSIEAAALQEELLAKKRRALLERPVNVIEGDVQQPCPNHCPTIHDAFLAIPTTFDICDPSPHDGPVKSHKSKGSIRKHQHDKIVELPKLADDEAVTMPDFHLPHIDTNRLEVGVKVVYPGKEKVGGKRNPSRNARLKLHNYHVKTPPHPPPPDDRAPASPDTPPPEAVVLPRLPISPIKSSQTQPAKPTAPAAPILVLPKSIASPIKPTHPMGGNASCDASSHHSHAADRSQISHARVRGKQPVRSRFKFSDTLFRSLQN